MLTEKNWDFPKIHSQLHLFDDIIAKGATRNYNTKPNESLNCPFKGDYTITNFQDVDEQVCWLGHKCRFVLTLRQLLQLDHFRYTICFIQAKIEVLDETTQSNDMGETIEPSPSTSTSTDESVTRVYLGSSKKATTVAEFASSSAGHGLTYPTF